MAKKPTYKIPRNLHTKNFPSYTYHNERESISFRRDLLADLEAGYPGDRPGWGWTKETWTAWMESRVREMEYEWLEPVEFVDTLSVKSWSRGRSAAGMEWTMESTGGECYMMISEIFELLSKATIIDGKVTGRWIFKKKGANYGICYLGPVDAA